MSFYKKNYVSKKNIIDFLKYLQNQHLKIFDEFFYNFYKRKFKYLDYVFIIIM